jgi:arylsulfatase A-like enzyme
MKVRLLSLLFAFTGTLSAAETRPNVVILFADDLGWADLGCYGSTFHETPNLDRLAKEGTQFTNFYSAAPVCSPTRASLMTGKYPSRTGITDWIPGMKVPADAKLATTPTGRALARSETTFAQALREAGYQTFYAGKWHLGPTADGLDAFGFDEYAHDPEEGVEGEGDKEKANAKKRRLRRESTDLFTRESLDFLQRRDAGRPFLLMLAYHDVHTPIQAAPDFIEHYRAKAAALSELAPVIPEGRGKTRSRQDHPEYASTVASLDRSVGQILARLDELGLAKNTIVVFLSDNGGLAVQRQNPGPTSNLPLRAGKGFLYEGGIRIPFLIRAPGQPGGLRSDTPLITMDVYPTILELAGVPARPAQHRDGVSFASLLDGKAKLPERKLFWNYPHYQGSSSTPSGAVREGNWKLVERYEDDARELFDLAADPGERHDLAAAQPEVASRLAADLEEWRKSAGAIRPRPTNPSPSAP